jgi:hypothetical protein
MDGWTGTGPDDLVQLADEVGAPALHARARAARLFGARRRESIDEPCGDESPAAQPRGRRGASEPRARRRLPLRTGCNAAVYNDRCNAAVYNDRCNAAVYNDRCNAPSETRRIGRRSRRRSGTRTRCKVDARMQGAVRGASRSATKERRGIAARHAASFAPDELLSILPDDKLARTRTSPSALASPRGWQRMRRHTRNPAPAPGSALLGSAGFSFSACGSGADAEVPVQMRKSRCRCGVGMLQVGVGHLRPSRTCDAACCTA